MRRTPPALVTGFVTRLLGKHPSETICSTPFVVA
jgi:hypothetical protein